MSEDDNKFKLGGNWGTPRGLYDPRKYYVFSLNEGLYLVAVLFFAIRVMGVVFPSEQILQALLFLVLVMMLAVYLILPSSAGGKNFRSIIYFHTRRKKRYFSIDRNVYPKYKYEPKKGRKRR